MRKLTIVFILLGFIAGCGQKGSLYHSNAEPQPASEPAEKSDNKQEDNK